MTQQKHTPGPWKVSVKATKDGYKHIRVAADTSTMVLANVNYLEPHEHLKESELRPGDIRFKEAEANARLIAAAPELLHSLNMMLNWAMLTVKPKLGEDMLPKGFERAQAVLNKATL